jgi:hypothetical protein
MKRMLLSFLIFISMCEKDNDQSSQSSCLKEPISIDIACLEIYEPVCGCDGFTYSNTCYATISGVLSWTEGECPN